MGERYRVEITTGYVPADTKFESPVFYQDNGLLSWEGTAARLNALQAKADLLDEAVRLLERFADMARDGDDLSSWACSRGVASDKTFITNGDWHSARAFLARIKGAADE